MQAYDRPFVDATPADDDAQRFSPDALALARRIALEHGTDAETLRGKERGPELSRARRALYVALRLSPFRWSYPEIGRFVGRHHTTVIHGCRVAPDDAPRVEVWERVIVK